MLHSLMNWKSMFFSKKGGRAPTQVPPASVKQKTRKIIFLPPISDRLEAKLKPLPSVWSEEDRKRAEETCRLAEERGEDWRIELPELIDMLIECEEELDRFYEAYDEQIRQAMELDEEYRMMCEAAYARAEQENKEDDVHS